MTKSIVDISCIGISVLALALLPVQALLAADKHATPVQYFGGGTPAGLEFSVTVPAHKTLVIEELSVACLGSPTLSDVRLFTTVGGVFAQYTFLPTILGANEWIATQTTHIYADPGSTVHIAPGNDTSGANCAISISGRLLSHDE
jgi:hypothetical protein